MNVPLRVYYLATVICLPLYASLAIAQTTLEIGPLLPPHSPHRPLPIGQPAYHRFEWGTMGGYGFRSDRSSYRFFLDMEGRFVAPQFGLLDLSFEGLYGTPGGKEPRGAFGASVKLLNIRNGFEYDLSDRKPYYKLSLQGAPRRGGFFGLGDRVRIDYTPARKTLEAGIKLPLPWAEYRASRPRSAHVAMPHGSLANPAGGSTSRMADPMARVLHSMEQVDRMLTPNLAPKSLTLRKGRAAFESEAKALAAHIAMPGHSFAAEDSAYHAGLRAVFAAAAGNDPATGEALASAARETLLRTVILPYNRLLGRIKRPGAPTGLLARAGSEFNATLDRPEYGLSAVGRTAAAEVFRQVSSQLDASARAARRRWHSWRLVWIPLNFGLKPNQYDTQAEVDAIIGDLVDRPFSSANKIRLIFNDEFLQELRESILETQRYQVLWIHDYSGRNGEKKPDRIAWGLAVDGYMEAFVRAIHAMDRGERDDLPEFLVLLDEHYYRGNGSESVVSFLENLGSTKKAPAFADRALRARVEAGVARLREAIAASGALRNRGARYVRERVKVHVVITHTYDPTFVDDMVMRDHTKVAFRDVFEDDPASGEAFFTGLGIGEHYVGPHWEDRTLAVRGTETASIKAAARALMISQGLKPSELPGFLSERPYPASFAQTCDSLRAAGWTANVLTVTNGTGFRTKAATVLKAAIYNLMQRGSVLLAPDSLWTSDFWAAMFISAAIRGCHVFPIAPAVENAPSSALSTMGVMHETMWLLFRSSEELADGIRAAGGTLRVGLYTNEADVGDVRSLVRKILDKDCQRAPLRDRIRIHPSVADVLRGEYERMRSDSTLPVHAMKVDHPHKPHMHLKAQFFANEAALALLEREEWAGVVARYLDVRRRQTSCTGSERDVIGPDLVRESFTRGVFGSADSVGSGSRDSLKVGDAIALSTLGSHNQDRRSMLLDGEVLTVVAGEDCLPSLIDFAFLMQTATWPARIEDLDACYPKTSGLLRRLSRWLRDMI